MTVLLLAKCYSCILLRVLTCCAPVWAGSKGAAARWAAHVGSGYRLPVPHAADCTRPCKSLHLSLKHGQAAEGTPCADAVCQRLSQLGQLPRQLQGGPHTFYIESLPSFAQCGALLFNVTGDHTFALLT